MRDSKKRALPSGPLDEPPRNKDEPTNLKKPNRKRAHAKRGVDLIAIDTKKISDKDDSEFNEKISCLNKCFLKSALLLYSKTNNYDFTSLFDQYKSHLSSFKKKDEIFSDLFDEIKKDAPKKNYNFKDIFNASNSNSIIEEKTCDSENPWKLNFETKSNDEDESKSEKTEQNRLFENIFK